MSISGISAALLATVTVVCALKPLAAAVIVVVPGATPDTTPGWEPVELSTVATAVFEDCQLAEVVTFWFEPSLYRITATICSLACGAIEGLITLSASPVAV